MKSEPLKTQFDFSVCVHTKEDQYGNKQIREAGTYEPNLTKDFQQALQQYGGSTLVIDVGAYIGWYSLAAAQLNLRDTEIHCFEPYYETYNILVNNIVINHYTNIIPHNVAVGNMFGMQRLYLNSGPNLGDNRTYPFEGNDQKYVQIPMVRLDDTIQDFNKFEHLVMKIDAQGGDLDVLMGAKNLINSFEKVYIIIEVFPAAMAATQQFFTSFIEDELKLQIRRLYNLWDQQLDISHKNETLIDQCQLNFVATKGEG